MTLLTMSLPRGFGALLIRHEILDSDLSAVVAVTLPLKDLRPCQSVLTPRLISVGSLSNTRATYTLCGSEC